MVSPAWTISNATNHLKHIAVIIFSIFYDKKIADQLYEKRALLYLQTCFLFSIENDNRTCAFAHLKRPAYTATQGKFYTRQFTTVILIPVNVCRIVNGKSAGDGSDRIIPQE